MTSVTRAVERSLHERGACTSCGAGSPGQPCKRLFPHATPLARSSVTLLPPLFARLRRRRLRRRRSAGPPWRRHSLHKTPPRPKSARCARNSPSPCSASDVRQPGTTPLLLPQHAASSWHSYSLPPVVTHPAPAASPPLFPAPPAPVLACWPLVLPGRSGGDTLGSRTSSDHLNDTRLALALPSPCVCARAATSDVVRTERL